jgi:hypothetical protein
MTQRSSGCQSSPYRLELLPRVPAFTREARQQKDFEEGQLVYYGPMPKYYGIGEVKRVAGSDVAVDFRGTGNFDVHEEIIDQRYLMRIPSDTLDRL